MGARPAPQCRLTQPLWPASRNSPFPLSKVSQVHMPGPAHTVAHSPWQTDNTRLSPPTPLADVSLLLSCARAGVHTHAVVPVGCGCGRDGCCAQPENVEFIQAPTLASSVYVARVNLGRLPGAVVSQSSLYDKFGPELVRAARRLRRQAHGRAWSAVVPPPSVLRTLHRLPDPDVNVSLAARSGRWRDGSSYWSPVVHARLHERVFLLLDAL